MLDLFYSTEKPLPADRDELYSALRVASPEQKTAVEFVLKKFWRGAGGRVRGYVQQRASKELAKYRQYRAKQSTAGKRSALVRNQRSTQAKLAFNPPSPSPSTTKPPYPPYVLPGANAGKPTPLPPSPGGPFEYVSRYGDVIEVCMGRHKKLPNLNGTEGARAQQIAEAYIRKGFPARVMSQEEVGNLKKE